LRKFKKEIPTTVPRLPQPGQDNGTWGEILNEYLSQALSTDGSLRDNSVGSAQLQANSVTSSALAPNSITNAALSSNAVTASTIADGSITEPLLDTTVLAKLNATVPDATTTSTGTVQLAGDLGGTATAPIVTKTYSKSDIGLGDVDNTSDANKPVSTAQATALNTKVTGAASATDNAIARFDTTSGKSIQNSAATIDDSGNISAPGTLRIGANLNQPNGIGTAQISIPGGKNVKGIVVQQTSAAGTSNMLELQRPDGGLSAWFDAAANLRMNTTADVSLIFTNGATSFHPTFTNSKTQIQAANPNVVGVSILGSGSQVSDLLRLHSSDGTTLTRFNNVGELVFSSDTNLYRSAANTLKTDDTFVAGAGVNANSNKITNVAEPTTAQDAATKNYVDTADATKQNASAIAANGMGVVAHGAVAGTARPTGFAGITWIGSVSPTNAVANDIWVYKA